MGEKKYAHLVKPLSIAAMPGAERAFRNTGNADINLWLNGRDHLEGLELNFSWGFYTGLGDTTPSYNDTNVTNGYTYYYYIRALNGAGESPKSNTVSALPLGRSSPPLLLVATSGDGFVQLDWEPPESDGGSDLESYNILRGPDSGGELQIDSIREIRRLCSDKM